MNDEPMIQIRNVRKSFGPLLVLRNISMDVHKGEVVALIGPSGSGKSTLLRCVNLLTEPDGGTIRVGKQKFDFNGPRGHRLGDKALAGFRAQTGMVFQHFNLFTHMTVVKNVMEGLVTVRKCPKRQARERAMALLEQVGLAKKAEQYPDALSGGQKQRVAIARALAMQPAVMLFDEATSALDPELVGEVLNVIQKLAQEGMTMLLVTHEIGFAREVADTIVFMREGVVIESGAPAQVIDNPQQEATCNFLARVKHA